MDRLIATNSVNLAGADGPPLTGTPQYATDGNPGLSIPATRWPAYQYNAIQEEIMNVLIAAGITPDKANNAQLLAAIQSAAIGRKKLAANTTVNIGGVGDPYATFALAVADYQKNYDVNQKTLTFKWNVAGACTEAVQVTGQQAGVTDPAQYVFDFGGQNLTQTAAANFIFRNCAMGTIQNATLSNTSVNSGVVATDRGFVNIGVGVIFGSQNGGAHIVAQLGGRVAQLANFTITGGGGAALNIGSSGSITLQAASTITLTGTPAFSNAFALASPLGYIQAGSVTFTGAATGARYNASGNGVINTGGGGANYFPGNSAGSVATGGQYF